MGIFIHYSNKMIKKVFTIFIFFLFIFLPLITQADLGPKPTMNFNFIYHTEYAYQIISGVQIICHDISCNNSKISEDYGPQGFRCLSHSCNSMSYGYEGKYNIIKIQFADKTRVSNVFENTGFNSRYDVIVDNDKLTIGTLPFSPNYPVLFPQYNIKNFLLAFFLTIIIELIVGLIFIIKKRLPKKILLIILFGNFITIPLIWFLLPKIFSFLYPDFIIIENFINELIVILIEAFIIYYFCKNYISWKTASVLSIIINLISWIIGGIVEYIVGVYIK